MILRVDTNSTKILRVEIIVAMHTGIQGHSMPRYRAQRRGPNTSADVVSSKDSSSDAHWHTTVVKTVLLSYF